MNLKSQPCRFAVFLAVPMLAGCAAGDALTAQTARTRLLGMSELQLETCLGLPDQKNTIGKVQLLTYYTNSMQNLSLAVPVVYGIGVSLAGYCHATFRLENDRVTEVRYTGETDSFGAKDSVCAPIVRSCLANEKSAMH